MISNIISDDDTAPTTNEPEPDDSAPATDGDEPDDTPPAEGDTEPDDSAPATDGDEPDDTPPADDTEPGDDAEATADDTPPAEDAGGSAPPGWGGTTATGSAPPPGPGAPGPPPPRRLVRSRDRKIAGVAGGIAEYFGIDPVIIRLGFVIATFAGFIGAIAYVIAWIVLPDGEGEPPPRPGRSIDTSTVVAIALLALAVAFGISDPFDSGVIAALLLVGAGVYLLHQRPLDTRPSPGHEEGPVITPPAPQGGLGVAAYEGAAATRRLTSDEPLPEPLPPPPPPREPAVITRLAISVVALVFAAAIAVDTLGWIDVDVSTTLAIGLVVVGIAALAAAFLGRGRGLIPIGIVLALAFAGSALLEPIIEDGVGDREHRATTIEEVEREYLHGIGRLEVDLRELEIPEGTTVDVEVELGIGEAVVLVPDDVDLRFVGDVDMGELVVREIGQQDIEENGIDNQISLERDVDGAGVLMLDLEVLMGSGRVERG